MKVQQAEKAVRGKKLVTAPKKWGVIGLSGLAAAGATTAEATLPLGAGGILGVAAFGALTSAGGIIVARELGSEQAKLRRVEHRVPELAERAAERLNRLSTTENRAPQTLIME